MAVATAKVEVSFSTNPLAAASWVDISAYVLEVKTTSGRSRELGPFDVSSCSVKLDNTTRRFDPFNASGPYYGQLLPNKQIRVTSTLSATTYDTWYGYIDGWPQTYGTFISEITITASDAFKLLSTMPLPESVYWLEVMADTPLAWYRFKEDTGQTNFDSSVNAYDASLAIFGSTMNGVKKGDVFLPEGMKPVAQGTIHSIAPAAVSVQSPISFEFWHWGTSANTEQYYPIVGGNDSVGLGAGTAGTSDRNKIWWFTDLAASGHTTNYVVTNNACVWDGKPHHIVITRLLAAIHIYVDGVDLPVTTVGSIQPLSILPREFLSDWLSSGSTFAAQNWMTEVAVYASVLSSARVSAHYSAGSLPWNGDTTGARAQRALDQVGWPSARYDLDAGNNSAGIARLGGRSCADYLRVVESTEQGQCYINHRDGGKVRFAQRDKRLTATRSTVSQYTFSDDSAATYHYEPDIEIVYDERDIVNEVQVKWQEDTVIVSDTASQATYGKRSLKVETEMATAAEASDLGGWVLARYKDPQIRVKSLTLLCSAANANFLPALELRINDRVTVVRKPQNTGTAITEDLIVEGIDHEIVGVSTWRTTLRVSAADAGPWFVWDTAKWDSTTRWGY